MARITTGGYCPNIRTEEEKMIDHHKRLIRMYEFDLMVAYRDRDEIKQKHYKEQVAEQKNKFEKLTCKMALSSAEKIKL